MSREINFRAWSIKEKEMVAGFMMSPDGSVWQYANQGYLCNNLNADEGHKESLIASNIPVEDEFILMQFTGLHDKNGKGIYEGDIIEIIHPHNDRMFIGVVEWGNHSWGCEKFHFSHFDNPTDIFSEGTQYIEVKGNIYDNPELLKP